MRVIYVKNIARWRNRGTCNKVCVYYEIMQATFTKALTVHKNQGTM